jgi:hypothetical protein
MTSEDIEKEADKLIAELPKLGDFELAVLSRSRNLMQKPAAEDPEQKPNLAHFAHVGRAIDIEIAARLLERSAK